MGLWILMAALFGALAVGAIVLGVRSLIVAPRDDVLERVERVARASDRIEPSQLETAKSRSLVASLVAPLARLAKPSEGGDLTKARQSLTFAGFRGERAVEVFFGAKIALAVVLAGGILALNAVRLTPIPRLWSLTIVLAAIGFYAPNIWLRSRVSSRQLSISKALPDGLDMLVTCVEAGLGMESALQRVTKEIGLASPLLSQELRLTSAEMHAGVSRSDAFRRLAARNGVEELRSLSAMLIQTEMFGTSIAKALRVHSAAMRVRRTHRAEERGATVSAKLLIPLILCILPSLFCVILGPAIVRIINTLMPVLGGGK